jgi:16S rRNA (guanine527-N7)-methyltransferase
VAINLTALSLAPLTDDAIDRLFIEPLAAARYVTTAPILWFDVGSGGGSPAIPLKIIRPLASLTMVESKGRKAAFLSEVVRELNLEHTDVVQARFEKMARPFSGNAQLITLRAVSPDQALFVTAAELLEAGGHLLWFGGSPWSLPYPPGFGPVATVPRLHDVPGFPLILWERVVPRGTLESGTSETG